MDIEEEVERSRSFWKTPVEYGPGSGDPLATGNKVALVSIAALTGCILLAISFMVGDNGTQNDANNRGPSGQAQNRADSPPSPQSR